jgi:hypothetical protein
VPNLSDFRSDSPMIFMCWEMSYGAGPDKQDHGSRCFGICDSRQRSTVATAFRASVRRSAHDRSLSLRVRPSTPRNPVSVSRYARQRSLVSGVRHHARLEALSIMQRVTRRAGATLWSPQRFGRKLTSLLWPTSSPRVTAFTCTKRPVTRLLGAPVRVNRKHNLCVGYLPHDSVMSNDGPLYLGVPVSSSSHSQNASAEGQKGTEYVFKPRSNQV